MRRAAALALLAAAACLVSGAPLLLPGRPERAHASAGPAAPAVAAASDHGGGLLLLPSMARDGPPPGAELAAREAYQGGAYYLRVTAFANATAEFLGISNPLTSGAGGLSTFIGVPTWAPLGPALMTVTGTDALGQAVTLRLPVTVLKTYWTVDDIILPPGVGDDLTPEIIRAETDRLTAIYAGLTAPAWSLPWTWPVAEGTAISGYFGEQRSFDGGPPTGHHGGTDFASGPGDPVSATNAGTVVLAEALAVRGKTVIVDHGGGVFSLYAHLSAISVGPGEAVSQGTQLGAVGSTGLSTAAHLHWELAVHGVLVDGLRWLDGTQGF